MMTMVKSCVALGSTPLLAVTVPVNVPATVGVPLITPALFMLRPVGSAPDVTLKVGVGEPVNV